jgi:hypothetical protein
MYNANKGQLHGVKSVTKNDLFGNGAPEGVRGAGRCRWPLWMPRGVHLGGSKLSIDITTVAQSATLDKNDGADVAQTLVSAAPLVAL